jgi:hypothetical protein
MPYDKTKDPNAFATNQAPRAKAERQAQRFPKGTAITPSDTVDLTSYANGIVVTAAGNLKLLPSQNDDADPITFTSAPVGFVPPFQVRRVFQTGTTASVASLDQ